MQLVAPVPTTERITPSYFPSAIVSAGRPCVDNAFPHCYVKITHVSCPESSRSCNATRNEDVVSVAAVSIVLAVFRIRVVPFAKMCISRASHNHHAGRDLKH